MHDGAVCILVDFDEEIGWFGLRGRYWALNDAVRVGERGREGDVEGS